MKKKRFFSVWLYYNDFGVVVVGIMLLLSAAVILSASSREVITSQEVKGVVFYTALIPLGLGFCLTAFGIFTAEFLPKIYWRRCKRAYKELPDLNSLKRSGGAVTMSDLLKKAGEQLLAFQERAKAKKRARKNVTRLWILSVMIGKAPVTSTLDDFLEVVKKEREKRLEDARRAISLGQHLMDRIEDEWEGNGIPEPW